MVILNQRESWQGRDEPRLERAFTRGKRVSGES